MSESIELSRGLCAVVDDGDYAELSRFKWSAMRGHSTFYAVRSLQNGRMVLMHRVLLGMQDAVTGENLAPSLHTDHRNRNGLDNRRTNLRCASARQNALNSPDRGKAARGVTWDRGRWKAQIRVNGRGRHLGRFKSEADAHDAYNAALRETGDVEWQTPQDN